MCRAVAGVVATVLRLKGPLILIHTAIVGLPGLGSNRHGGLVGLSWISSGGDAVLQIYRWDHRYEPMAGRTGHHGVLIKGIDLKEIWSPDKVAANTGAWDDHTPEWFAGGTFEFLSDCRQLIHRTRWGNTVRINLEDEICFMEVANVLAYSEDSFTTEFFRTLLGTSASGL
jgi:hypothetical protein